MTLAPTVLIALVLTAASGAADRPAEIPLWPGGAPGSAGKTVQEVVTTSASGELSVSSIHNPSLTPYLPAKDKATGLAILVSGRSASGWCASRNGGPRAGSCGGRRPDTGTAKPLG